jgi:hypothetical protein
MGGTDSSVQSLMEVYPYRTVVSLESESPLLSTQERVMVSPALPLYLNER